VLLIALSAVLGALAAPAPAEATTGPLAGAEQLGCRERITGAFTQVGDRVTPYRFRVQPRHDTRFGPLALSGAADYGARGAWDALVRDDMWPKTIALVRRGRTVTLEVPREQRGWMRLEYARTAASPYAVTLSGCRRGLSTRAAQRQECGAGSRETCTRGPTPFSGGFTIDYARAPRQGRCAELIVWVQGRAEPMRRGIFRAPCRASPVA
jgi:hypothetical protein